MDNKTLIELLSKRLDISTETTTQLIDGLAGSLGDCLEEADSVVVAGFGTFEPRKRMERVALHPATGKRLLVPPKIVVNFRSSQNLKQRINNGE